MKKYIIASFFTLLLLFSTSTLASAQSCTVGGKTGSCVFYGDCSLPNVSHQIPSQCEQPLVCCVYATKTPSSDGSLGGTITGIGGYNPGDSIETASKGLSDIISNIVGLLTIVAGISFLIYFTVGGLSWITAGGDTGKIEEAKDKMTGGAIGMIIVVAAWAISWILGQVLGVNFLNPVETLIKLGPGK